MPLASISNPLSGGVPSVIGGTLTIGGNLTLNSTTATSSTTTGALVVAGGVGIGGDIRLGGALVASTGRISAGSFRALSATTAGDFNQISYDGTNGVLVRGLNSNEGGTNRVTLASVDNSGVYPALYTTGTTTPGITVVNNVTVSGTGTNSFSGLIATVASATGSAGLRLPHGAAPTSPTDGDMWTTTAGLFVRINGVTKTVTLT